MPYVYLDVKVYHFRRLCVHYMSEGILSWYPCGTFVVPLRYFREVLSWYPCGTFVVLMWSIPISYATLWA